MPTALITCDARVIGIRLFADAFNGAGRILASCDALPSAEADGADAFAAMMDEAEYLEIISEGGCARGCCMFHGFEPRLLDVKCV